MSTFDRICELENQLLSARRSFLTAHGWSSTCQTPGSFWMWKRDFTPEDDERAKRYIANGFGDKFHPYGIITTGMETAIQMTVRELVPEPDENDADPEDAIGGDHG